MDVVFKSTINSQDNDRFGYMCSNDGHGEHYKVVRCNNCGLHYCSPRPAATDLELGYQETQDVIYQEEIQGRRKTFQRNLRNLSRYKKKGRLLDIGCYLGIFIDEARKVGWDAEGIEPSKWCVKQAKEIFGLNVRQGTYKDVALIKERFDVITMWDVLEHVDSPMYALQMSHNALEDDGILVFSTIDIGSLYVRLLGRRWPWLMKMHIYYFDRKCIRKYLEKAGFKLLEIRVHKYIVSLEYLIYKLKRVNKFLFFIMNGVHKICCLFKNKIFLAIAFGDFMEVYAQKIPKQIENGG